ncbi:MAG: hypothetical protein MZV70_75035 [Desulfobacterales bacterium]|nr:hypothetical protein [Desulfobacterales bacterium]
MSMATGCALTHPTDPFPATGDPPLGPFQRAACSGAARAACRAVGFAAGDPHCARQQPRHRRGRLGREIRPGPV